MFDAAFNVKERVSYLISVELTLERLKAMPVVSVQSQLGCPEADALEKILEYAKTNVLTDKSGVRLFGRNFYPFEQPEPHGYEFYLTLDENVNPSQEFIVQNMFEGLYATLRVRGVAGIPNGWHALFSMVESAGYVPVGVCRQMYGWVTAGFEEIVNWQQQDASQERITDLWLQLKE